MTGSPGARRLRVLAVSPWGPWRTTDGSALVLHHHLARLGPRHDIRLLTVEPQPADYTLPGVDISVFTDPRPPGLAYAARRLRGLMTGEPAHVYYAGQPALVQAFDDAVARGVDVLHLFGWGTAHLAARAPQVPTVHVAIDEWSAGFRNRMLPRWRRLADLGEARAVRRHERRHYPRQGAVVVVADRDAESLRRAVAGARIEVVPNGVELGPEPGPMVGEPVLVLHGAMSVQANVDAATYLVRDVLPLVREAVPSARVLLVGRDPAPAVRRLAGPSVTVTGSVPDVRVELDRAAVYVAPLVSGTGLKNKVLEAMAAGLPVVGTPLALEGIGMGPGIAVARTAEEMASAVVALLRDPARREIARRQARMHAEEFSWDDSADRIEELWLEVVRSSRR